MGRGRRAASRDISPQSLGLDQTAPAYRTAATNAPGVLLELLYVSNDQDAAILRDESARMVMAVGVARAILRYLTLP